MAECGGKRLVPAQGYAKWGLDGDKARLVEAKLCQWRADKLSQLKQLAQGAEDAKCRWMQQVGDDVRWNYDEEEFFSNVEQELGASAAAYLQQQRYEFEQEKLNREAALKTLQDVAFHLRDCRGAVESVDVILQEEEKDAKRRRQPWAAGKHQATLRAPEIPEVSRLRVCSTRHRKC